MEPTQIKAQVSNFYDSNEQGKYGVLQKLLLPKQIRGKKVLDAGCGAGYIFLDYLFWGAEVTGVDNSSASIEFLREQCNQLGLKPTLIVGDLETVNLPERDFDYIFCTYVLMHTPNPEGVLRNFTRWGKPGATVKLVVSNRKCPDYYLHHSMIGLLWLLPFLKYLVPERVRKGIHWADRFEHPYWRQKSKEEVRALCEKAGLKINTIHVGGGFTIFITSWLPPILTILLDKAFGKYWGKAIYVEAII